MFYPAECSVCSYVRYSVSAHERFSASCFKANYARCVELVIDDLQSVLIDCAFASSVNFDIRYCMVLCLLRWTKCRCSEIRSENISVRVICITLYYVTIMLKSRNAHSKK
jgi:hypothetical protein